MHVEEMTAAIGRAHGVVLDDLTRALWSAHAAGEMNDDQAQALCEAIQARRLNAGNSGITRFSPPPSAGEGGQTVPPLLHAARAKPHRPVQRPPIRSVAIERRRRLAASGPMPPTLAARFTTSELAVLRIVADEIIARGACSDCLDAIAARAGVSRTKAKQAIREAARLGMLERQEHRRAGAKSLPNTLRIIDREWLAWLKRGAALSFRGNGTAGTFRTTTDTVVKGRSIREDTRRGTDQPYRGNQRCLWSLG